MGNARSTNYTGLSPGHYTFKMIACNADGVWNEKEAFFSFYLKPYFYQTFWFYLLVVLFVLLAVFSLYRFRVRQLKTREKELSALVELRTRDLKERNVELESAQHKLRQSKELIEAKNLQLEKQSEKLKEMDKVKSRFFANISHEFRTPLTLILGPLDRIRSRYRDQGLKKEVGLVFRNAQRLLGLINQLLDLSKFESGKMKLRAGEGDLVLFLKSILEPFESAAARSRLALTFYTAAASIPLFFDPEKLEKVMTNLLSNAFKFTPPKGRITVSAAFTTSTGETAETPPASEGYVSVSVKDTGTGIPADQLVHIFDRFYQADTTVEHHQKGSGIGLALVKELVELHHGEITVNSKVGENSGTEFIVRLPMGSAHLSPAEIIEGISKPPDKEEMMEIPDTLDTLDTHDVSTDEVEEEPLAYLPTASEVPGKNIILVVEDNADLRRYIRTTLEPEYIVKEAANGREGIKKARTLVPDLIISDIMMPEADGYELCRTLKNDISTSHIPVILLTAKVSEENIVRGLETRADDYITKPFNTRVLMARIRNLIDLRRQLQMKLNREMVLQPSRIEVSEIDREFIKDLQEVIEKNLSDPEFNVEDLSKRLYMSRSTVYRKIQALSGETPTDFIRSYRLLRATQLLKSHFGSVTEVAFEVGFTSRAYFTKCFKEKFHQLPSEYISSE
jgi:signal transduction histidine kinase/DNA-binding response OmpR family regulator